MAIILRSGFNRAVASVAAYLAARGVTASVVVGEREVVKQINQGAGQANRVVFVPYDGGNNWGTIVPPLFAGDRNVRDADGNVVATVRALADVRRRAYASIWAAGEDPNDDVGNVEAVETLLEQTMLAIHSAPGAFASVAFGDLVGLKRRERAYGLEVQVNFTFRHPIYFDPLDVVFPASAAINRGSMPDNPPPVGGDT